MRVSIALFMAFIIWVGCGVSYAKQIPKYPKKILLVVAMQQEAAPIIKELHLHLSKRFITELPMRVYSGTYANTPIFLIMNGKDPIYHVENIGTQPAALSTYLGIRYFNPDLVISIGTAGGVTEMGAKIADVYISDKIFFYDRRSPQKKYREYGLGNYSSMPFDAIAKKINLKKGNICTGDSFDISPTDKEIILKHRCSAVEMEAASVAWVSMLMKKPMIAIKGIGDLLGSESNMQYAENADRIQRQLGEKIKVFISQFSK